LRRQTVQKNMVPMPENPKEFDLIVIGGAPPEWFAPPTTAAFGKTVAVVDSHHELGGAGAGVIGSEYACTFTALGTEVHVLDGRDALLSFLDAGRMGDKAVRPGEFRPVFPIYSCPVAPGGLHGLYVEMKRLDASPVRVQGSP